MSIDIGLGKQIEHIVCQDCKAKIAEETKKVSKFDLIRPNRLATKFFGFLCKDCHAAVRRHYGK